MSIVELKAEIDRLPPEDLQELREYLRPKIRPMSSEMRRLLTQKINDKNPANWVTLEEAEKILFPSD